MLRMNEAKAAPARRFKPGTQERTQLAEFARERIAMWQRIQINLAAFLAVLQQLPGGTPSEERG